jgi:hypothetical protein
MPFNTNNQPVPKGPTNAEAIAGPKILEHMVDTVIYFEGDQLGSVFGAFTAEQ